MFNEEKLSFATAVVYPYNVARAILEKNAFTQSVQEKIAVFVVGANGSGKSTFIANLYEKGITNLAYLNADILQIKNNLDNPYVATKQTMESVLDYMNKGLGFIYESVFSDVNKLELAQNILDNGYKLIAIYISTASPNINLYRVAKRVEQGGHNVPPEKIILRHEKTLRNIQALKDISSAFYQFDNSKEREI